MLVKHFTCLYAHASHHIDVLNEGAPALYCRHRVRIKFDRNKRAPACLAEVKRFAKLTNAFSFALKLSQRVIVFPVQIAPKFISRLIGTIGAHTRHPKY